MSTGRIPSFDAIRAGAALFGIVLHVGASYMQHTLEPWPHFGSGSHIFFDILVYILHMVRVPVFFLLAGYFSVPLLQKLSYRGFIRNRLIRIVIPFLVCALLININTILTQIIAHKFPVNSYDIEHLWFLEYLSIYCGLFLIVELLLIRFVRKKVAINLKPIWLGAILFLLTYTFLYQSHYWFIPTYSKLNPDIWLLAFYACYFFAGVIFNKHQDLFERFFKWRWQNLFGALMASAIYLWLFLALSTHSEWTRNVALIFYAAACWLFLVCFISSCRILFGAPNKVIAYLARASYWIYLAQIFFIIRLHPLTNYYFENIFVQFAATCVATLMLTLFSYQLLNRTRVSRLFSRSTIQRST